MKTNKPLKCVTRTCWVAGNNNTPNQPAFLPLSRTC